MPLSAPSFIKKLLCFLPCKTRQIIASSLLASVLATTAPFAAHSASLALAGKPNKKERQQVARDIDPSSWNLSAEGEHMYYYLLLSQALRDGNDAVIAHSLQGLLKLDPALPVFQDSATIFLSRGEFDEAEKVALSGLKHFPGDATLTLLLAGAYSENKQPKKAIELLEKYTKKTPEHFETVQELARLYLQEKQDQKALDLLASIPKKSKTAAASIFHAKVLASVGKTKEAQKELMSLLEKEPDFVEAWLEIGYMAEQQDDIATAINAYKKVIVKDSSNMELWFRVIVLQLSQKKVQDALATINEAPASSPLFMQASLRFADAGYYKEADAMLEKAKTEGGNPDELALFQSVIKHEATKKPLAGIPPLESISPKSPLYPNAMQRKAHLYAQAEQYQNSYDTASATRKTHPEKKELWGIEAYALVKLGKPQQAEDLLQEALKKSPKDEDLLFSLGHIQDEAGKKDLAMQTMESIIKINPKNASALNYVGYSLVEKNTDLERALALITKALEVTPDASYIVDSLAWAQFRLGRLSEAWESINRSLKLGGDKEAAIWEHYADIALALGKKQEAQKGYQEALKLNPDNAKEIRDKLTTLSKSRKNS